jgi:hypothetical protein
MEFPKGTQFDEEIDPETGKKIKIAILPNGEVLKFWTEEELSEI